MSTVNRNPQIFLVVLFASLSSVPAFALVLGQGTDTVFTLSGKFKPESLYGNRISLLNNNEREDKVFYFRTTIDTIADIVYGLQTYQKPVVESRIALRTKNIWGNPNIFRDVPSSIRLLDTAIGEHSHSIPRILFWMREGWIRFPLGKPIGLDLKNRCDLTLGIFPFELGRGIALGDSYAAGADSLGFYSDSYVDMYAPGGRLSADLIPNKLSYDLYGAFLQNKSSSFNETGAKILSQEFGKRAKPQRGFGVINYVVAARLQWKVFDSKQKGSLMLEPYALFNRDPEQKIQFLGDAKARLATVGLAAEYAQDCWECGAETAFNFGSQRVKGWDRNAVEIENRNGNLTFVNSHVILNADPADPAFCKTATNYKAPYAPKVIAPDHSLSSIGKTAQTIINAAPQGAEFNGQPIGVVPGFTIDVNAPSPTPDPTDILYNACNRYRNPYSNTFKGWMIIGDAAFWFYKREVKVAVTGGVASGDANPNEEIVDGDYKGFIGLQEAYVGKRVPSAFVLGAGGKLKRPLSVPTSVEAFNAFSSEVSGFTDLALVGTGVTWIPANWKKQFSWNTNVLAFWEHFKTHKFNIVTRKNCNEWASPFLGTEINTFIRYDLVKNLRFFTTIALFIPGGHYSDIKGKPLNAEQNKKLDELDLTGDLNAAIPNLGNKTAFTINAGFEFKF